MSSSNIDMPSSSSSIENQHPDDISSHHYETVPADEEAAERIHHHLERSSRDSQSEIIRVMITTLTDGLTIPFALAAGLSSSGNRHLVILGCLAELMASTITISLGGWVTSKAAEYRYRTEREEEERGVKFNLDEEIHEMIERMQAYDLDQQSLAPIIDKLSNNPERFVDFMMKFESNLERPNPRRSLKNALVSGASHLVSGLIPLIPYFFIKDCVSGLYLSGGITLSCLILFGYFKALYVYPSKVIFGALQSILVGIIAVVISYGFVFLISNNLFEFI